MTTALSADIEAAPVTISGLSASNKTYDTNRVATLSGTATAAGVLAGDTVSVSGSANTGTFASPNVASGIAVTADLTGLTLSNSNYVINGVTTALSADIEAAPVTVIASNQNTTYGTSYSLGTSSFTTSGLLGGDVISAVTLQQAGNVTIPSSQNAGIYSGATNGVLA
ncbi:hypothetical protein JZU68_04030, partial [bacterium]|nr:hypothetical protein [bacterium]